MFFKLWIGLLFFLIVFSLFKGLTHLVKQDKPQGVLTSLKLRVALSALLVVSLVMGYYLGLIQPHTL
jgi:hypothetical protein